MRWSGQVERVTAALDRVRASLVYLPNTRQYVPKEKVAPDQLILVHSHPAPSNQTNPELYAEILTQFGALSASLLPCLLLSSSPFFSDLASTTEPEE